MYPIDWTQKIEFIPKTNFFLDFSEENGVNWSWKNILLYRSKSLAAGRAKRWNSQTFSPKVAAAPAASQESAGFLGKVKAIRKDGTR